MTRHRPFHVGPGRRAVDVAAAAVLIVLTAPLVLVAAVLILLTDGRPVLFRQERVGEDGVPFRLTKLRTMRAAPAGGAAEVTATGDPRITRVGAALRRTSIDELPQLWHVLTGRMTLVGPRPESVGLAARYPESCRPGAARPAGAHRSRTAALPGGVGGPAGRDGPTSRAGTSTSWCRCGWRPTWSTSGAPRSAPRSGCWWSPRCSSSAWPTCRRPPRCPTSGRVSGLRRAEPRRSPG